jgi:hypothetical protein
MLCDNLRGVFEAAQIIQCDVHFFAQPTDATSKLVVKVRNTQYAIRMYAWQKILDSSEVGMPYVAWPCTQQFDVYPDCV